MEEAGRCGYIMEREITIRNMIRDKDNNQR
jgi:hypothetical protein